MGAMLALVYEAVKKGVSSIDVSKKGEAGIFAVVTDAAIGEINATTLPAGPSADDFLAAFGVGDGAAISPMDAIGVCQAAIQGLFASVPLEQAILEQGIA